MQKGEHELHTGSNLMYFVATCTMVPKKGVTSAGILNTIDSKALEGVS
jgi:hypothetical protein